MYNMGDVALGPSPPDATVNSELKSLVHRTTVLNLVLLVLRITVNPLLWSILERTKGDRISETTVKLPLKVGTSILYVYVHWKYMATLPVGLCSLISISPVGLLNFTPSFTPLI